MSEATIERFELETISDRSTGVLVVRDFDKALATAKEIVAQHPISTIETDAQKKDAKAFRATLNKVIKAIDRRRIDTIADFATGFEQSCNEIKAVFSELERQYKTEIEAYEERQKAATVEAPEVKQYVATIKFTDEKLIKKLTDFCTKNGCALTIK